MNSALPRQILGWLIMAPRLIELEEVVADDFPAGRLRQTFQAISKLWEDDHPAEISLVVLADRLGGDGAATFTASLLDGLQEPTAENFAAVVRESKRRRISEKIVTTAERLGREHLKTGAFDEAGFQQLVGLLECQRDNRGNVNVNEQFVSGTALQALEIETAWSVEKLVPSRSITLLHSPGGLGKTWFSLGLANAVSRGEPLLGLATKRRPVCYIDFENPLPLLIDRTRKLDIREVLFWHLSASIPPPKLDTSAHVIYRQLPAGSLIVFDTLRAAHDGDENSSQDMALVMGRLKELRELGFDIFLIHHTAKANERLYKGSTAISDLADHVLKLYRTRKGSLEEIQDEGEPDPDATFVLATGKTRFEPFHLYLSFDPRAGGFSVAEDPNLEALEAIAGYIAGPGRGLNQTDVIEWAKDSLGGGRRENFVDLLKRGEREGRWRSRKNGRKRIYEPAN
jgi:hypothetical protein